MFVAQARQISWVHHWLRGCCNYYPHGWLVKDFPYMLMILSHLKRSCRSLSAGVGILPNPKWAAILHPSSCLYWPPVRINSKQLPDPEMDIINLLLWTLPYCKARALSQIKNGCTHKSSLTYHIWLQSTIVLQEIRPWGVLLSNMTANSSIIKSSSSKSTMYH